MTVVALDTTLYHLEDMDDELGSGARIYTSEDHVYEVRSSGGFLSDIDTRLYRDDGDWHAKVRFDESDEKDAYEIFRDVAERIEDEYGDDPFIPAIEFMNGNHGNGFASENREISGSLRYNAETPDRLLRISQQEQEGLAKWYLSSASSYVTTGTGIGATTTFEPTGALAGGAIGVAVWAFEVALFKAGTAGIERTPDLPPSSQGIQALVNKIGEKRLQKKFLKGKVLEDEDFFDRLNEKNYLESTIADSGDYDAAERLQELRDANMQTLLRKTMKLQFGRLEKREGVVAEAITDSYEEARLFAATVLDEEPEELEEPSIYRYEDAFRTVFGKLPRRDRRKILEHAIEEGEELVGEISGYLQSEHGELLEDLGEDVLIGGAL